MTRAEARKQINTGWITVQLAALLMGFDLDTARLQPFMETGAIQTQRTKTGQLLSLKDLLAIRDVDVNKTLDKLWPVDRRKKTTRVQTIRVLETQTAREAFNSRWFRVYRALCKLISEPDINVSLRELKLMHQLLALSRKAKGFELILTNSKLMELTRLDDEWLPKTRRALEARGLVRVTADGAAWVYTLLDPKTKQPFGADEEKGPVLLASESWTDIDDVA